VGASKGEDQSSCFCYILHTFDPFQLGFMASLSALTGLSDGMQHELRSPQAKGAEQERGRT